MIFKYTVFFSIMLILILILIVFVLRYLKKSKSVVELLQKNIKFLTYLYLSIIFTFMIDFLITSNPGFYRSIIGLTTVFASAIGLYGFLLSTHVLFTTFINYLIRKNEVEANFLKLNLLQREMVFDLLYLFLEVTEQPEEIVVFFIKMLHHQNPEIKEFASKKLKEISQLEKQALQKAPELKIEDKKTLDSLEEKRKIQGIASLILKLRADVKENDSKNGT